MTRPNTRLTDADRNTIENKVRTALNKRRRLVQPMFGKDAYAAYVSFLPQEVQKALEVLHKLGGGKFDGFLQTSFTGTLNLKAEDERQTLSCINFNFVDDSPYFCEGWKDDAKLYIKPAHPRWKECIAFFDQCQAIDLENGSVEDLVAHTVQNCNTFGQIDRVWPDLLPTIGGEKVAAAQKQRRASQLPVYLEVDRIIEEREAATNKIAQGIILPDLDRTDIPYWAG